MAVEQISTIRDVGRAAIDELAWLDGPVCCYDRLLQSEETEAVQARYFVTCEAGKPIALVPTYVSSARRWADSMYDPARWGLGELAPSACYLVGAPRDLKSVIYRRPTANERPAREVLAAAVAVAPPAAALLPWFRSGDRALIDAVVGKMVDWRPAMRHFSLGEAQLNSSLPRERSDEKLIAAARIDSTEECWNGVDPEVLAMLVAHNRDAGTFDHIRLAERRYSAWLRCETVQVVVFRAWLDGELLGVLTSLRWSDQLLLYEIGLPGSRSRLRYAAYVLLGFRAPLRYARRESLNTIHLGVGAEDAKLTRGASDEMHWFGRLNARGNEHP